MSKKESESLLLPVITDIFVSVVSLEWVGFFLTGASVLLLPEVVP